MKWQLLSSRGGAAVPRWVFWTTLTSLALTLHLTGVASLPPWPAAASAGDEEALSLPSPTPSLHRGSPTPTPTPPPHLTREEAIELVWKGQYEQAEAELNRLLEQETGGHRKAELFVYLALLATIRQQPETAKSYLRQALQLSPGLMLDPVQFPRNLRDLLAKVRAELLAQRARPRPGTLPPPVHVLAPPATPPGWSNRKKWYERWYVWAGAAAAASAAAVLLGRAGGSGLAGTPTPTPTSTPRPDEFVFGPVVVEQIPDCEGVNGPNEGQTFHGFPFPEGPDVFITYVRLTVQIQGDYNDFDDPTTPEDEEERVRILIERFAPPYIFGPAGGFCTSQGREIISGPAAPDLIRQIQEAAQDGQIDVTIRPEGAVNENCVGTCNPFHRVTLEFRYRFRVTPTPTPQP